MPSTEHHVSVIDAQHRAALTLKFRRMYKERFSPSLWFLKVERLWRLLHSLSPCFVTTPAFHSSLHGSKTVAARPLFSNPATITAAGD